METDATTASRAHTALREATSALHSGKTPSDAVDRLSEPGYAVIAADVAATLDALAALLRSVGVPATPPTAVTDDLHATLRQITAAADLARRAGETGDEYSEL